MTDTHRFKLTKIEDTRHMDMYLRYLVQLRGRPACTADFSDGPRESTAFVYRPCHNLPKPKERRRAGSLFRNQG